MDMIQKVANEYFNRGLLSKLPIIKVTEADLIITGENDNRYGTIGFKTSAVAKAGDLEGHIYITCEMKLPDTDFVVSVQDEKLNKLLDNFEVIRTKERIPLGCYSFKKEKEKNDTA